MPDEYFKEIEINNWRGIFITIVSIILVLSLLIIPNYTAINSYSEKISKEEYVGSIPLNNSTVTTYGDFFLDNDNILHTKTQESNGYAVINYDNKTILTDNETLTLKFVNMMTGSNSLTLSFFNTTYFANVMTLNINIEDEVSYGLVSMDVNGISIGSKSLNIFEFRANPIINISILNNSWIIYVGNAEFNITNEPFVYGDLLYIPANQIRLSGQFFWFYGLENITLSKINIETHSLPLIKNMEYFIFTIILGIITAIAIYYKPENYLEITFLSIILMIILVNLSINMTIPISYAVSISLALIISTIVVKAVDFTNIENIDQFLEKHLWKLTIVWILLLAIYLYYSVVL